MTAGQAIPLEGVSVEVTICDFCSRVTLMQRYRNREDNPIEAVYVFPIDEAAAVCGFEALIDDVHVVGEVKERDEAFEIYDDALAEGHGAYLLDQERPDVFTASIGNVPPGKEVLIKITYVAELQPEGEDLRFVLPTTVSPRYAPAEDRVGVSPTPAEAVNPEIAWKVPYGLELTVELEMPSRILALESPSHPLSVEIDDCKGTVRLGGRESTLDRDFVLLTRLAEPHEPRAWVEKTDTGSVAMVAFQPKFEVNEAPCEIVFVVDRSGSMYGNSIEEARNALQLCLRSLPEGSLFNIVGFGSEFKMLFGDSRPYNEDNLNKATRHIEQMDADLGGTEILSPLEAIFELPPHPELPRQLFILTDGHVTNDEAVIKLVRNHSSNTRVFSFGIGAGASHHLVQGIARAGNGAAELIYPNERIEGKVMRQLGRALSPALSKVKIDWGNLEIRQAPHHLPPVFADGRFLVYGFVDKAIRRKSARIELTAKGPQGDLSFEVTADFSKKQQTNMIATLAARTLIRDLEEGASALHDRRGSLRKQPKKDDRVKQEAVRLGAQYGLCSQWTSFVAVEHRESPVDGELQLRKVPVALTRDWGGLGSAVGGPAYALPSAPPPMQPSRSYLVSDAELACSPPQSYSGDEDFGLVDGSAGDFGLDSGAPDLQLPRESSRPLDRLVALQ
ncbi:MAG: VIT domain-containing protein, partial [Thermoanaerobaculia bacterium]